MVERVDVGAVRRSQIVEAARRVIRAKGIQGASLAEIEQEAGISRGVLTYHFPTKDSIILAVFDATIERMREHGPHHGSTTVGWDRFREMCRYILFEKPQDDDFDCLLYTFLAQMSHRADIRKRLADEHASMRIFVLESLAEFLEALGPDDARALVAILHATAHGLVMQLNADPQAFDRERVFSLLDSIIVGFVRSRSGKHSSAVASVGPERCGSAPPPRS
jgi:AcrR family transcriptional regulator